jgi:hypothetical protein
VASPGSNLPAGHRRSNEDQFASILLQLRKVKPSDSALKLGGRVLNHMISAGKRSSNPETDAPRARQKGPLTIPQMVVTYSWKDRMGFVVEGVWIVAEVSFLFTSF